MTGWEGILVCVKLSVSTNHDATLPNRLHSVGTKCLKHSPVGGISVSNHSYPLIASLFFFFNVYGCCVCLYVCMCVNLMYAWFLLGSEESIKYPVIGVTDGCEAPLSVRIKPGSSARMSS